MYAQVVSEHIKRLGRRRTGKALQTDHERIVEKTILGRASGWRQRFQYFMKSPN